MARCGCAEACNCVLISGGGVAVSGTGTSEDPYVIAYSGPGGSFVEVTDTATVDMSITGDGSGGTPYDISAAVIPGTVVPQTEATQDIVGAMAGDGLQYDDPTGILSVKISTDANNNAAIGTDGGIYTGAGSGSVGSSIIAFKTIDEVVTNSSVFQSDNELFLPVSSGATYILDASLIYTSSLTADMKLGFTVPAGGSLFWTSRSAHQGATIGTGTNTPIDLTMQVQLPNFHTIGGLGVAVTMFSVPIGTLFMAGTAGVLQTQWAQNVAEASDTTIYGGSYIRLTRVA